MARFTGMVVAVVAVLCAGGGATAQERAVSYARDVKVILVHRCYECHGGGKAKGGLSLASREGVLKGGKHGAGVVAGKGDEGAILKRVTSSDPDEVMPPEGERLTAQEVGILKRWIEEGVVWDEISPEALKGRPANVLARRVVIPGEGNIVDRAMAGYFARAKVGAPGVVDDGTFARRAYLDLVGLPPTVEELGAFLADARADKRAALVRGLLADDQRYAEHWVTFWQDHLRDGKMDLGTTDVFRPITPWLVKALRTNLPYDRFVRELVDPVIPPEFAALDTNLPDQDDVRGLEKEAKLTDSDSFGFLQGLRAGLEKPRGDQRWEVQAVQNIAQVFLGVNLKCATCHDSLVDAWTMKDVWGMAGAYANEPLEMVRCEVPTGVRPAASFVFPEVGTIDASAPVAERRKRLAALVTSERNGRFARTVVNRLWARLVGRGIIDPVDEMDGEAFDADLLDALAGELVDSGYDLKRVIELIVTSRAYQMPVAEGKGKGFRGPVLRRLTAEQFVDGLNAVMGRGGRAWKQNGGRMLEILGRPDRRTVATTRDEKSSPMQALEMLNGPALFEMIYLNPPPPGPRPTDDAKARALEAQKLKANPRLAELAKMGGRGLVERVVEHALSRRATEKEMGVYLEMVGERPTPESVGDFLWVVGMLPEFQLIR